MRRPRSTEMMVDPHLAQWGIQALTRIMALFAVGIGIQILAGGPSRFAGLSYEAARGVAGAPWSWGGTIALAGLISLAGTLMGKPGAVSFGLYGVSAWAMFFALAFTSTATTYPTANTTAPWVYAVPIGVGCFVLAGVHLSMILPDLSVWLLRKVKREAP